MKTYYIGSRRKGLKRKAISLGHILYRNCFLKHVIEGKREGQK
jgi:hypothetical protein